jgi:hypothetical protein
VSVHWQVSQVSNILLLLHLVVSRLTENFHHSVYLAAVLYLAAEILELAGNTARSLGKLLGDIVISQGGVGEYWTGFFLTLSLTRFCSAPHCA